MKWIRPIAAATGLLAATLSIAAGTASAVPVSHQHALPVPVLDWHACDGGFQCATAQVPLDYQHPSGTKISLALVRHQATDPTRRLGTMFVNLGGPMEQIERFVSGFAAIPKQLRARYDIVSFDPRGFGFSTAVRCFSSVAAENKFLAALPPFPVGARQDAAWERTWARFDARCAQRNGSLLAHVSSADTARDMDLLRQAVGAPTLNYLGVSNGSALGAIYANLFPATTGHMVLDGSVDPVAYSTGTLPVSLREGQDLAIADALRSYLDLCGEAPVSACVFSAGTPATTEVKFATLERRLLRHPVMFGNPPHPITYADMLAALGSPLGTVGQWQSSAAELQQLWLASAPSSGAARSPGAAPASGFAHARRFAAPAPAATGPAPAGTGPAPAGTGLAPVGAGGGVYTGQEQYYAVNCADVSDPRSVSDYAAAAQLAQARAGGYGLFFTWFEEPCALWPATSARDRYTGPWNRPTASTILVMSLTGDPLTTHQDAIAMTGDLANARLLTIAGWGHTELANPSACAIRYEVGYLTAGALPPAGTVCAQNGTPFPVPSS